MTKVRKMHIKKEVKITPKKITIKYKNTTGDAILKIVERDDPMTTEQQAWYDALADSLINDAEEQSDNDERQEEMDLSDDIETVTPPTTEPEAGEEVELSEESGVGEETDEDPVPEPEPAKTAKDSPPINYENMGVPVFDGTEIPDFKKMEKGHIEYYINKSEAAVITEDVFHNFAENLNTGIPINRLRTEALKVIFEKLKIVV